MSLFNPTKEEVRIFFCDTWKKHQTHGVLTPLETIAAKWIVEHPEYHQILSNPESMQQDFSVENGQTNPFLHLSMHLSIAEQIQIDQPIGIKEVSRVLLQKNGSEHDAAHHIMECLGKILWEAQRNGTPPDMHAYIESIRLLV
ncbi:MAG: DUF1841 family protein [Betaproteobacteria bacterium]|jgi:hypothetical protein